MVDVDAGYGVSRTVEGAGVLCGGVPYRRPVVGADGQGDFRRQGGVQLEVVFAHVHEGGEDFKLIGCADRVVGLPVRACAVGGEEVGYLGLSGGQCGQGALGGAAGLVVVEELLAWVFLVPLEDGKVPGVQVYVVQVLEGAGYGGAGYSSVSCADTSSINRGGAGVTDSPSVYRGGALQGGGVVFCARTLHPHSASVAAEGLVFDGVAIFLGTAAGVVASIHFAIHGGGEAGVQRSVAVGARYAAHDGAGVSRQRGGHAGAEVEVAAGGGGASGASVSGGGGAVSVLVESHHAAYAALASGARYLTRGVAGDEGAGVLVLSHHATYEASVFGALHRRRSGADGQRSAVVEACHASHFSVRLHRGLVDAVLQASAYVACHDGGHAVFACYASCHGHVLHRGAGAVLGGDGSEEALVVGLRALYVEARDGESSTVEAAGVGG